MGKNRDRFWWGGGERKYIEHMLASVPLKKLMSKLSAVYSITQVL